MDQPKKSWYEGLTAEEWDRTLKDAFERNGVLHLLRPAGWTDEMDIPLPDLPKPMTRAQWNSIFGAFERGQPAAPEPARPQQITATFRPLERFSRKPKNNHLDR